MVARFFFASWLLVAFFLCTSLRADAPDRPNILWLSAEDIGPHLGCYGYDVATPNLDRLARKAMRFDMAWSNYPVCAPARTTIITGMYATSLGAGNMRCAAKKPRDVKLLPELMRSAGYYCTNSVKTDYNLTDVNDVWDDSSSKAHWKNRPEGKPFFSVFNYTGTHESNIRKRPHAEQIDPANVSLFPYWPDAPEIRQDWAQYLDNIQTMDQWVGRQLTQLEKSGAADDTIVFFWGDHGSGMPRHKRYVGDSGMRVPLIVRVPEKWKQFYAANFSVGGQSDWPVGFVDFAPTVLKIAGAEIPSQMQGKSFLGKEATKAKYVFGMRNRMDERVDLSRSVCDGRFLYIRNFMPHLPHGQFIEYQQVTNSTRVWFENFQAGKLSATESAFWKPRSTEELYDLEVDPFETESLASNPLHQQRLSDLRTTLRKKMSEIIDLDLVPESMLYEYERATSKPRLEYQFNDGFSFDVLLEAAFGNEVEKNLESEQPEVRYWAIIAAITSSNKGDALSRTVAGMLDDDSKAVQVKAADFCLSRRMNVNEAIERLIALSLRDQSNYYVACDAVDCLDRYRKLLSEQQKKAIRSIPVTFPEISRGNDNMQKLIRRFEN